MRFVKVRTFGKSHIFANPNSLRDWIELKRRGYVRHRTPVGDCYIKPKPQRRK